MASINRLVLQLCVALWLGVVAWVGIVYFFSSLSGREVEQLMVVHLWDKFLHFLTFSAGAVLLAAALRATCGWPWKRLIIVTGALISLYGAVDEWHQQFTPGRSSKDVGDWSADTLGGFAGAAAACFLHRAYRRRRPAPAGSAEPLPAKASSPDLPESV